jgi:queuine tRNA-ribosyltransferase
MSLHNIYYFQNLMQETRESIKKGEFKDFKTNFLLKQSEISKN